MSWSEFGAGTLRAHFGHIWGIGGCVGEKRTQVPIVPKPRRTGLPEACPRWGENPHEGNPHRILSPVLGISKYLSNKQKSRRYEIAILAGVGWSELELDPRGHNTGTTPAVRLKAAVCDSQFPISRLYVHVRAFSPAREEKVIVMQQVTKIYGR